MEIFFWVTKKHCNPRDEVQIKVHKVSYFMKLETIKKIH